MLNNSFLRQYLIDIPTPSILRNNEQKKRIAGKKTILLLPTKFFERALRLESIKDFNFSLGIENW